jgi:hypothetical protein
MDLATVLGSGPAFLGAAVTVVGLAVNASNNRRAKYDRILTETAKISQGVVADARHSAGTVLERGPKDNVLSDETVNQIFDVLWAFERLDGLYESLRPRSFRSRRPSAAQRLLLVSCRGAITTWHEYSNRHFTRTSGDPVSFVPSNLGVRNLYGELRKLEE